MSIKDHKTAQPDEADHKILELSLSNPALTDQQIGERIGLSREAVVRRKKRPGYQQALQESFKVSHQSLQNLFGKAIARLSDLMDDSDPRIQLASAANVLKYMPDLPVQLDEKKEVIYKIGWADEKPSHQDTEYTTCWGDGTPTDPKHIVHDTTFGGKSLEEISKNLDQDDTINIVQE